MSKSFSLSRLLLVAPFAWGGLLLFTRYIPPHTLPAFIVFFLILAIGMICIFAPIAYFIGAYLFSSRLYQATSRHALRQGTILALIIILNLILRALHSWSIFTAIVILVAAIVIEIISLARK